MKNEAQEILEKHFGKDIDPKIIEFAKDIALAQKTKILDLVEEHCPHATEDELYQVTLIGNLFKEEE